MPKRWDLPHPRCQHFQVDKNYDATRPCYCTHPLLGPDTLTEQQASLMPCAENHPDGTPSCEKYEVDLKRTTFNALNLSRRIRAQNRQFKQERRKGKIPVHPAASAVQLIKNPTQNPNWHTTPRTVEDAIMHGWTIHGPGDALRFTLDVIKQYRLVYWVKSDHLVLYAERDTALKNLGHWDLWYPVEFLHPATTLHYPATPLDHYPLSEQINIIKIQQDGLTPEEGARTLLELNRTRRKRNHDPRYRPLGVLREAERQTQGTPT